MGFIIHDEITTAQGFTVTDAVATIRGVIECIKIDGRTTTDEDGVTTTTDVKYRVKSRCRIYKDVTKREICVCDCDVLIDDPTVNLYDVAYTYFKGLYVNVTDDL